MANRVQLKNKFESGKCPKQEDYHDLIDSTINFEEDKVEKPGEDSPLVISAHGIKKFALRLKGSLQIARKTTDSGDANSALSLWQGTWAAVVDPIGSGNLILGGYNVETNVILAYPKSSEPTVAGEGGKVGVGTVNPSALLHLTRPKNSTIPLLRIDDAQGGLTSFIIDKDGNLGMRIGYENYSPKANLHIGDLFSSEIPYVIIGSSASPVMQVSKDGNIGIHGNTSFDFTMTISKESQSTNYYGEIKTIKNLCVGEDRQCISVFPIRKRGTGVGQATLTQLFIGNKDGSSGFAFTISNMGPSNLLCFDVYKDGSAESYYYITEDLIIFDKRVFFNTPYRVSDTKTFDSGSSQTIELIDSRTLNFDENNPPTILVLLSTFKEDVNEAHCHTYLPPAPNSFDDLVQPEHSCYFIQDGALKVFHCGINQEDKVLICNGYGKVKVKAFVWK
jgi:hypothetical protein